MKRNIIKLTAGIIIILIITGEAIYLGVILKEKQIISGHLAAITKDADYLQTRLRVSETSAESLKKMSAAQNQQILEQKNEIAGLEGKVLDAVQESGALRESLNEIKALKENVESEYLAVSKQLERMKAIKEAPLKRKLGEVKKMLSEKNKEAAGLKKKVNTLENKLSNIELKKTSSDEQSKNDKLIRELENQVSGLSKILVKKELELHAIVEGRDNVKAEIPKLQAAQCDLINQLTEIRIKQDNAAKLPQEVTPVSSGIAGCGDKAYQALTEKEKADELKKKIEERLKRKKVEVILIPEEE